MNKIKLESNTMYILSGIPGSGKSGSVKYLREHVVSTDEIRKQIAPVRFKSDDTMFLSDDNDPAVFKIANKIVKEKCKNGLTVFIDATNISDIERKKWVKIAEDFHMPYKVLIFDIPLTKIKSLNKERTLSVSDSVIEKFNNRFQKDSIYPFMKIKELSDFELVPKFKIYGNIDFIGDVHGCLESTKKLIKKLGYDDELNHTDPNRKLLFLGDFIDRGPNSIETLDFIKNACEKGHYAVVGNHELKLIRNIEHIENNTPLKGSLATRISALELLKRKDKTELLSFIQNLPFYYIVNDEYLAVHANIVDSNPLSLTKNIAAFGDKYIDTDKLFDNQSNAYKLVRGHIEKTYPDTNVIVLETKGSFGGYISSYNSNSKEYTTLDTNFDYLTYINPKRSKLLKQFEVKKDLINVKNSSPYQMFKYKPNVFYDNLWDETLIKCRGIVFDMAENLCQHPFDKVFNYLENGTAKNIADNEVFTVVEKMNGFLLNVSYDHYRKDLLITTTGSFDSDFVNYGKDLINKEKLYGPLIQFLRLNKVTLSFEAIHKNDPHIIPYSEEGLWLIGARELKENSPSMLESEVTEIGKILEELSTKGIKVKRPRVFRSTFANIKKLAKTKEIEGYMVRRDHEYICKFKTHYYLIVKFLSRLSDGKIKFMYANTNKFKEDSDEDVWRIIDLIVNNVSKDDFLSMDKIERRDLIQKLMS